MTTITQEDRDFADKAFDIAFHGDTDGIDDAMAELFASAREMQAERAKRNVNLRLVGQMIVEWEI